jgi:hypothetical protein
MGHKPTHLTLKKMSVEGFDALNFPQNFFNRLEHRREMAAELIFE